MAEPCCRCVHGARSHASNHATSDVPKRRTQKCEERRAGLDRGQHKCLCVKHEATLMYRGADLGNLNRCARHLERAADRSVCRSLTFYLNTIMFCNYMTQSKTSQALLWVRETLLFRTLKPSVIDLLNPGSGHCFGGEATLHVTHGGHAELKLPL